MAHLWQVRSTQLNAYKTQSLKDWAQNSANSQIPALVADASAGHFGGFKIDVRAVIGKNAITYCGIDNVSGQQHTFHIRFSPTWTGFPSRAQTFFIIGPSDGSYNQGFLIRFTTAGKVEVTCLDKSNNARVNFTTTNTLSCTSGTPVDVYVSIDNTITTNACKVYWNQHGAAATLQHTNNASTTITRDARACWGICIGVGEQGLSDFYLVEANIWNSIEDPTLLGIRTDFITATAYEGFAAPSASQVVSGNTILGVAGTAVVPAAADVRLGTNTGTTTGTLDLPAESDVSNGVTYDNGTKTGTRQSVTNVIAQATLRGQQRAGILRER